MPLNNIVVFNKVRALASDEFQQRIPEATRENIATIGYWLEQYDPSYNEFTGILAKIAMSMVSMSESDNPLSIFDKGDVPFGSDIEDIFVDMAKGLAFDKSGSNTLDKIPVDERIHTLYYRQNDEMTYSTTVSIKQMRTAFMNANGLNGVIDGLVEGLQTGKTHDNYVKAKNMLAAYKNYYTDYQVGEVLLTGTDDEIKALVLKVVNTINKGLMDISFTNNTLNSAGVYRKAKKDDLVVLINKDIWVEIKSRVYGPIFHMDEVSIKPTVIPVDDFGLMSNTYAVVTTKKLLGIWNAFDAQLEQHNAKGAFRNIFLHSDKIRGIKKFEPAVRITFDTGGVDETDILQFVLDEQTGAATIDAGAHTVAIEVATGTDVTALVPGIEVSTGATVSPKSGVEQDFTNPVVYTVTAEDGTTQQVWTVTVTVAA